jgi:two-component system sensor histidine kinase UhpB
MSVTKTSRRRSEARDRLLAHVAFDAVWERDLQSGAVTWDRSLESIFGYHLDEVVNHVSWWRERVHPDDLEHVEQIASQAIQSGASCWSSEYRFRRKDGSWAWVASRCAIERDADGRARYAVGAMNDISQLKDAETRLRLFTEQIPGRACVTDRELRVVWDGGAAFPDSPSAVGKTVPELFAQSPDRERVQEGCRRALAGQSSKLEIDDGTSAAQLDLEPFRDPAGNIVGVVGIAFDVTDRVRSEEQVRAGQRLLRRVLEILPVGVVVLNRAGDVVLHNPASTQIWGVTIVSGQERWARSKGFWHGTGQAIIAGEWASHRALDEGQATLDELIDIETFDGERKTIENYAAPILDADGVITGAVVVNEDVTERVRAEEALRNTERLLVDAEKLGRTGSWEQDLVSGEIFNTEANRRLFFGDDWSKGTLMEYYIEAVHPDDRGWVMRQREQLHGGTGPDTIEFRVIWPDGSVHWIFGRATVVRDQAGRPVRAYGTNADVTERKRAEEELKTTTEQLRALSARLRSAREEEGTRIAREIHDDLGATLTGLRWELEGVKKAICEPGRVLPDLELTEKLSAMLNLTDTMITTVRRIASDLRPAVLDVLGLEDAIEWQARQFQDRTGIAVHCVSAGSGLGLNPTQSTAVFRIFQEALTNVLRHSRATRVDVTLAIDTGVLVLMVGDNGRGITESERTGESSIGLLGMRERAQLIGGEIDVSGVEGEGTTVTLRLPLVYA